MMSALDIAAIEVEVELRQTTRAGEAVINARSSTCSLAGFIDRRDGDLLLPSSSTRFCTDGGACCCDCTCGCGCCCICDSTIDDDCCCCSAAASAAFDMRVRFDRLSGALAVAVAVGVVVVVVDGVVDCDASLVVVVVVRNATLLPPFSELFSLLSLACVGVESSPRDFDVCDCDSDCRRRRRRRDVNNSGQCSIDIVSFVFVLFAMRTNLQSTDDVASTYAPFRPVTRPVSTNNNNESIFGYHEAKTRHNATREVSIVPYDWSEGAGKAVRGERDLTRTARQTDSIRMSIIFVSQYEHTHK
jgi:hypothetical protein